MNQARFTIPILVQMALAFSMPGILLSEDVTLKWEPNEEKDFARYGLFYGTEHGNYTMRLDAGKDPEYTVEGLEEGYTYYFALKAYDTSGQASDYSEEVAHRIDLPPGEKITGPVPQGIGAEKDAILPNVLALHQNYPNPFNPSTTIAFDIPGPMGGKEKTNLTIYDIRGRRVRELVDSVLEPGRYRIVWDGRDERGAAVPSGMYFYRLEVPGEVFVRKFTLMK